MLGQEPLVVLAERDGLARLDEAARPLGKFLEIHFLSPSRHPSPARRAALARRARAQGRIDPQWLQECHTPRSRSISRHRAASVAEEERTVLPHPPSPVRRLDRKQGEPGRFALPEEPAPAPEEDRHDRELDLVDQPLREQRADELGAAEDIDGLLRPRLQRPELARDVRRRPAVRPAEVGQRPRGDELRQAVHVVPDDRSSSSSAVGQ